MVMLRWVAGACYGVVIRMMPASFYLASTRQKPPFGLSSNGEKAEQALCACGISKKVSGGGNVG
jgi:hypothetical protein